MIMKRLGTGMLGSNCYILGERGEGVVIDPGVDCREILDVAAQEGLAIRLILMTHAHVDHILSADELRDRTGARVAVHKADARSLGNTLLNGSGLFGMKNTFRDADILLEDGQVAEAGGMRLEILHTPGHTPGSICIRAGDMLFSGDTLFRMSIGRTDLGNGDYDDMMASLKKLMLLEDDLKVYPGHGTGTTIGYERENNPFI
jgi:glyoxylase-like metal-dependent hydrolase (beta-lactamase superfamily II)